MKIKLTSVMVDDQDKALKFYTETLGFVNKMDMPAGEFKWLTVGSPEGSDDIELLLEPNANPALAGAAQAYQKMLFDAGIPAAAFAVDDIQDECERLKNLGVLFTQEPTQIGPTTVAVFNDTCGNLIQIYQV